MDMARIKLTQLSQHGDLLDRYGASIRILGQRDLVKPDVLEAMDRAVAMTSRNNKAVLNVCFPYTSRDEITTAIRHTVEAWSKPIEQPPAEKGRRSPFKEDRIAHTIRSQHLSDPHRNTLTYLQPPQLQSPSSSTTSLSSNTWTSESFDADSSVSSATTLHPDHLDFSYPSTFETKDSSPTTPPPRSNNVTLQKPAYPSPELITPATLTSHMFTASDPPLDLLVRTSGVERLSDFMLWQCHQETQIVFLPCLWPEFDVWTFLPVLWEWQWRVHKTRSRAREEGEGRGRPRNKPRGRSRGGSAGTDIVGRTRPVAIENAH